VNAHSVSPFVQHTSELVATLNCTSDFLLYWSIIRLQLQSRFYAWARLWHTAVGLRAGTLLLDWKMGPCCWTERWDLRYIYRKHVQENLLTADRNTSYSERNIVVFLSLSMQENISFSSRPFLYKHFAINHLTIFITLRTKAYRSFSTYVSNPFLISLC
jgi:hypothetical protein